MLFFISLPISLLVVTGWLTIQAGFNPDECLSKLIISRSTQHRAPVTLGSFDHYDGPSGASLA